MATSVAAGPPVPRHAAVTRALVRRCVVGEHNDPHAGGNDEDGPSDGKDRRRQRTRPASHRMPAARRSQYEGSRTRPAGHHGVGSGFTFGHQSATDEWGHMRTKKQKRVVEKSTSKQKELEKGLSSLRGQLTRTEKALTKAKSRADRWRKEAKGQKRSASRARARVEKLHQKLDGASAALEPVQALAPMEMMASGLPVAEPTTSDDITMPDETWSVVQLRAQARARGLTGMSNKTKAQLLAALS